MTFDPTANLDQLVIPRGPAGFTFMVRVATALALQYQHAGEEYARGGPQVQSYLDRAARLLWVARRDQDRLQALVLHGAQPARLDGDHTGGDAA